METICTNCNGAGHYQYLECKPCKGSGRFPPPAHLKKNMRSVLASLPAWKPRVHSASAVSVRRRPYDSRQRLLMAQKRKSDNYKGLKMTKVSNHDTYIAAAPEPLRPLLKNLHTQLARTLPDADETIAYNMPGFRIGTTVVAGYAAFAKQCGLYVAPGAISSLAGDIAKAGLKATKTGVTFSPSRPIPDKLIEKLARASRRDHGL